MRRTRIRLVILVATLLLGTAFGVELPAGYTALSSVTIPRPRSGVVPAFNANEVKGYRFRFATTDADYASFIFFSVVNSETGSGSYKMAPTGYDQTGAINDISGTVSFSGSNRTMFGAAWQDANFSRTADWYEAVFTDAAGNEIGHFYPCMRNADAALGFYDTVSQMFYGKGYPSWGDFTSKDIVDVDVVGSPAAYGVASPAYGRCQLLFGSQLAGALSGAVAYSDGVTAYPRCDAPGRARTVSATCRFGGVEETFEASSFVCEVAAGSVTWNFDGIDDAVLATAEAGGQVFVADGTPAAAVTNYYPRGSEGTVSVTAVPNSGCVFSHWSGDVAENQSFSPTLTLECSRSYALTAHFVALPPEYRHVTFATIPSPRSGVLTDLPASQVKSITMVYACREAGDWICLSTYSSASASSSPFLLYNDHTTDGSVTVATHSFNASNSGRLMFGAAWSDTTYSRTADWYRVRLCNANGEVLGDFLPCVRLADDVCGFYDSVTGTFYGKGADTWGDFEPSSRSYELAVAGGPADFGHVTPSYGTMQQMSGELVGYALTAPTEYPDGVVAYPGRQSVSRARSFLGADYAVSGSAVEHLAVASFARTFPESDCALTWRFGDVEPGIGVMVEGPGRVLMDGVGETTTALTNFSPCARRLLAAKPDEGARFIRWDGIDDLDLAHSPRVRVVPPIGLTAVFGPRHVFAPEYEEVEFARITATAEQKENAVLVPVKWKDVRKVVLKLCVVSASNSAMPLAGTQSLVERTKSDPWVSVPPGAAIRANALTEFAADPAVVSFGVPVTLTLTCEGFPGSGDPYVQFGTPWEGYHFTADWYEVSIYGENDEELARLWPCREKATDEVGFYDTVSQTFFRKAIADAADFTAPRPVKLPVGLSVIIR